MGQEGSSLQDHFERPIGLPVVHPFSLSVGFPTLDGQPEKGPWVTGQLEGSDQWRWFDLGALFLDLLSCLVPLRGGDPRA